MKETKIEIKQRNKLKENKNADWEALSLEHLRK